MLDSFTAPNNGNPYSTFLMSTTRRRRRSSSAQPNNGNNNAGRKQMPDVVAEVMARQVEMLASSMNSSGNRLRSSSKEKATATADLPRTRSHREERKNGGGGGTEAAGGGAIGMFFQKHTVERCHSQVNRPMTRPLLDRVDAINGRYRHGHRCSEQLERPPTPPQLTLVMMGAPRVGKSAMVSQFLWEAFPAEYRPTVEEFNWVEYGRAGDHPDTNFLLQIIDSSGSRDFLAMRHLYYRIGDAFMVVYAANDPQSYAEALAMLREICQQNSKDAPVLLLQNKNDLRVRSGGGAGGGGGGSDLSDCKQDSLGSDTTNLEAEDRQMLERVRRMRISAKNLEQVKGAFWWLIEELVRHSQITKNGPPPQSCRSAGGENGKSSQNSSTFVASKALTRRRQSMPSRRTASELGIDEDTLKRLMRKHEAQNKQHGCAIQ